MAEPTDLAPPPAETPRRHPAGTGPGSAPPQHAETTPPLPADAVSPYLGLRSFAESDRELFHGRAAETDELFHLVQRETVSVVFGMSGLGKSSLLRAGLFPRLRAANLFPVAVRLAYDTGDLVAQIRAAIVREIAEHSVDTGPPPDDQTLWEYFHRTPFWSARNRPLLPVIVLDQFEELFTLGHAAPGCRALLTELGDVIENRIPEAVRRAGDADALPPAFQVPKAKVILALREDYLARLEDLRAAIPSIARGRFRLRPMDGVQAVRAVRHARTAHLVDAAVAERIARFVAGARGEGSADTPLDTMAVEPALLSLVCRQLDEVRRSRNLPTISASLLTGESARILEDFYERSVAGLELRLIEHLEDHLLTPDGHRTTVAMSSLGPIAGMAPAVTRLIDRRILRIEERLGHPHVEVIHDVLTRVMVARRDRRRAERERQRRARRRIATLAGVAVALVLGVGSALYVTARHRLDAAAEAQRLAVEAERKANAVRSASTLVAEANAMLAHNEVWAAARVLEVAYGIAGEDSTLDLRAMVGRLTALDSMLAAVLQPRSGVTALVFSGDGSKLFAAHRDGSVSMWSTTDWKLGQLGTPGADPVQLAVSRDGRYALIDAKVWDTTRREAVGELPVVSYSTLWRVSDDGAWVTSHSGYNDTAYHLVNGSYAAWEPPALSAVCASTAAGPGTVSRSEPARRGTELALSSDGSTLVLRQYEAHGSGEAGELSVFDLTTPQPSRLASTCVPIKARVNQLAVNADGTMIALQGPCPEDAEHCQTTWAAYRRDAGSKGLELVPEIPGKPEVSVIAFDARRPELGLYESAAGGWIGTRADVRLHTAWRLCGARPQVDLTGGRLAMIGACGRFLLVDGDRPEISGELPFTSYSALRISATARLAASLSADGVIRVWRLDRSLDRVVRTAPPPGRPRDVVSITFHGNQQLTAYDGDEARMFSAASGQLLASAHSDTVPAVIDDDTVAVSLGGRIAMMKRAAGGIWTTGTADVSPSALLVTARDPMQLVSIGADLRYRWIDKALQPRDEHALASDLLHAEVGAIASAPSGRWMLGASADGALTRFDADGHRTRSLAVAGGVHDIVPAIHGDGLLAIGDKAVVAWAESGSPRILEVAPGVSDRAAAWDLATGTIVVGTRDGLARFDAGATAPVWHNGAPFPDRRDGAPHRLTWIDLDVPSPRPALLAAAPDAMGLFDVGDGQPVRGVAAPAMPSLGRITGSWFAGPGLLVTLGDALSLWNTRTGARVGYHSDTSSIARGPADQLVVADGWKVSVVRVQDQKLVEDKRSPCRGPDLEAHIVAWSPDGAWIATACDPPDYLAKVGHRGWIHLWNATTWKLQTTWPSPHPRITAMAFSPEHRLLTNGSDGVPRVWDVPAGKQIAEIAHERVLAASFVRGQLYVLTQVTNGRIRIYDARSARQLVELPARPANDAIAVHAIDGDTGWLVVAGEAGGVTAIDVRSGQVVHERRPGDRRAAAIAIAPRGSAIAIAFADSVLLWRFPPAGAASEIVLGAPNVAALAFAPDGSWLATAESVASDRRSSSRGLLRIWNADGGQLLAFELDAAPTVVGWSPDSRRVAVGGQRGHIKLVELPREIRRAAPVIEILDRIAPRAVREAASPPIEDRLPQSRPLGLIDI